MEFLDLKEKQENRKVSRKDIILKEATRLFRSKGYNLSSVRDLAQEAGIEAPSIYSHFKSKEHILKHICFEMAASFITGIERAENFIRPDEKLIKAISEHVQVVLQRKEASIVMWNEWRYLTEPSYQQFQGMVKDYENRFKTIIESGIKEGIFKKQDPEIISNIILTSLNTLGHWYKTDTNSIKELETKLIDIYFKGILN